MKSISLVDECITKFIKGGMERFFPRTYGPGALEEMEKSGIFMTQPTIMLTEDGIQRAFYLKLISELKRRSMLAALAQSGVELKGATAASDGSSQVA